MERMTAKEAINKIKAVKTTFMGHTVSVHNYSHEIKTQLQKMAERNEISPAEYWKGLKISGQPESESLRKYDYSNLI